MRQFFASVVQTLRTEHRHFWMDSNITVSCTFHPNFRLLGPDADTNFRCLFLFRALREEGKTSFLPPWSSSATVELVDAFQWLKNLESRKGVGVLTAKHFPFSRITGNNGRAQGLLYGFSTEHQSNSCGVIPHRSSVHGRFSSVHGRAARRAWTCAKGHSC